MVEYDRLPADLRAWLAAAALPWSPRSVARAFALALAQAPRDRAAALAALDRLQERRLASVQERRRVAGDDERCLYPSGGATYR